MTLQPSLFDEPETPVLQQVSPARIRSLAGILGGFAWPGQGKMTAAQTARAEQIAAESLAKLQAEPTR